MPPSQPGPAAAPGGGLAELAGTESAYREAPWRYDGRSAPRPRRLSGLRRAGRRF